jgi:hypothetical protein
VTPVESVIARVTEVPAARLTAQVIVIVPAGTAVAIVVSGAAEGWPPGIAVMM